MSHTPGPWTFERSGDDLWIRAKPEGSISGWDIATIDTSGSPDSEDEANGTLIAAAPELLSSAKEAFDYLDWTLGDCDEGCGCILHPLRAAIAKATGQEVVS